MYAPASHGYDDGSMRAQHVLLAVPSVAMAVVGFAMLGPGAVQPYDGARVRGGPTIGLRHLSWRIAVLQRFRGIDSTRNIGAVAVRVREGDKPEKIARCQTNGDGICDVLLDFPAEIRGPVHATVVVGSTGATLADGDIAGDADAWGRDLGHPARLRGQASGDFSVELSARRGVFAAPFRDDLIVTVRDGTTAVRGAKVTLKSDALDLADVIPPDHGDVTQTFVTSEQGEAVFQVTPRMHTVDVDVEVTSLGRTAEWHGLLPVVPGAIWLDPASITEHGLSLMSPVPRDVAYVTLATATARLWSAAVPLSSMDLAFRGDPPPRSPGEEHRVAAPPRPLGFFQGGIAWPPIARVPDAVTPPPMWLTVSSDPTQTGAGTVGWPVGRIGWPIKGTPATDERPFRDQLLLDGMPAAEKRDQHRRNGARALSGIALGAAAVLEGVLLAHHARARGIRAWAWTVMAVAIVALAFAAIGVVAMWKTSS
jgi:hypothetical protein